MDGKTASKDAVQALPGHAGAPPTVLLVEDDAEIGLIVSALLDDGGYRTVTLVDHSEIEAAIERHRPRCVVIDGEARSTGHGRSWKDAAGIRRRHPEMPILIFTADPAALAEARAGVSARSQAVGFAGVIGKPFSTEEFLAAVGSAIGAPSSQLGPAARSHDPKSEPAVGGQRTAAEVQLADVVGVAVHELRTPLAAISWRIQLASRLLSADPDRARASLDRAFVQVARLDRLIGELLDRSRGGIGAFTLQLVAFDLCAVVAGVVTEYELGDPRSVCLELEAAHLRVRGDPLRIGHIVRELLSNALKYGAPGSRVNVRLRRVDAEAVVLVEDHGVGVPAEEQPRLFEPYFRSTRSRSVAGSGLGLHLSRHLAELQGGRLWMERSTDAGSVFALALPILDL